MQNLEKIIKKFGETNILVVGDLILDEYIWGSVDRVSPEAPVPVVWANKRTFAPGGAANVANNIRSLDGRVSILGVVGKDKNAELLAANLKAKRINVAGILTDPSRCTTVKTRIVVGHQQIVRVDWEKVEPIPQGVIARVSNFIEKHIDEFDAIIIEDYGKGVINMRLLAEVIALVRTRKKIITVDPKQEHFQYYKGVTSITPNRKELENAIRDIKIKDTTNKFKLHNDRLTTDKEIDQAADQIMRFLSLESILVTLGELGMRLYEKGGRLTHIPTMAQEVFDVSGAGDTVISTFTLGLCAGGSFLEAAHIANYAAGIVIGKVGTAVTTRKEILQRLRKVS